MANLVCFLQNSVSVLLQPSVSLEKTLFSVICVFFSFCNTDVAIHLGNDMWKQEANTCTCLIKQSIITRTGIII